MIAEKMITYVTKLINAQINLSVQPVEKDTWHKVMTVKWIKIRLIIKMQTDSRVGKRASLQILAGEEEFPRS